MLASRTKSGIGRIKPLRVMYVYTEANGAGRVYRKKLASLLHGKLAMAPGSVTWADSRHGERN